MIVNIKYKIIVIPVEYFKKLPPMYSEISIISFSLNLKNKLKYIVNKNEYKIIRYIICAKLAVPKDWIVKVGPVRILGITATQPRVAIHSKALIFVFSI